MNYPKVTILLSIFRAERFLERYLEDILEQTLGREIELSVVHNLPSDVERVILDLFSKKIQMVRIETQRESLYKSWNRAIAQSNGEYLVCWNVDDLREADSLERMAKVLDADSSLGWTYGDFAITNFFGDKFGRRLIAPEWSKELATRGAIGGPFFMWRRNLLNKVGWFDEQFSSGADFDYTVRLSLHTRAVRTQGLIGYFLNEKKGLSTFGELQPIERTAIQLRYGIYETLDWKYVHQSLSYRVRHILQPGGKWLEVEKLVPDYDRLIQARRSTAWQIPLNTIQSAARQKIAKILRKI